MKRAFVYTGGEIFAEYIQEKPQDGDIVIAADSGYNNAKNMGVKVNILIGDFDSLAGELPKDVDEILQVPAKKDLTDTQLAVEKAVRMGATQITIVGSTSGRLDHALSMLAILEGLHERHIRGIILNGQNRVSYVKNTNHILLSGQGYKYFSLIATDIAKGVSIEGAKYPLKNKTLDRKLQFAVSNEIEGNAALITVKKGGILVIESRDI
ncbi:MAG: thiamine diphosphokinase [Ruminococcaceae bacterium]|nr:thiamine diphosphokinase [Oscillospiraceae bacterium]